MYSNCPICKSSKSKNILNMDCGGTDGSRLYRNVRINYCTKCGHVFNDLTPSEIEDLNSYYINEYATPNLRSGNKLADVPGGNSEYALERYGNLYGLIDKYANKDSKIIDVGCASGGFLDYLYGKGVTNLYGVDPSIEYVECANKNTKHIVKTGSAENIPFEDKMFDIVIMDQVLEHVVDPRKVFKEASRVLCNNGLLCLGMPDASRYSETSCFDFYWFLLHEHIQHFDIEHLKIAASYEGFEFVSFKSTTSPMANERMQLPNINALFRYTGNKKELSGGTKLRNKIIKYVKNELESLRANRGIIKELAEANTPLFVWGIGREFMYLYQSAGLKDCNIVNLIDGNQYKRDKVTIDNRKIYDSSVLNGADKNSALLITAVTHSEKIKQIAIDMGYTGKVITLR